MALPRPAWEIERGGEGGKEEGREGRRGWKREERLQGGPPAAFFFFSRMLSSLSTTPFPFPIPLPHPHALLYPVRPSSPPSPPSSRPLSFPHHEERGRSTSTTATWQSRSPGLSEEGEGWVNVYEGWEKEGEEREGEK